MGSATFNLKDFLTGGASSVQLHTYGKNTKRKKDSGGSPTLSYTIQR